MGSGYRAEEDWERLPLVGKVKNQSLTPTSRVVSTLVPASTRSVSIVRLRIVGRVKNGNS